MKYTLFLVMILCFTSSPARAEWAVADVPAEVIAESAKILSVDQQKEELFLEYQKAKDELSAKYDAAVQKLAEVDPEDFGRQKMLLEKEYKEEQKKRLVEYRRKNLALEKRGANLRGHMEKFDAKSDASRRLEKNRHLAPIVDTREKVIKRGPQGYVKKSQRSHDARASKSYGYMTKDKVETMLNKGSGTTVGARSH